MLSITRGIYVQTFAAPGDILLLKARDEEPGSRGKSKDGNGGMLLIQPRQRGRALDHATSHPASWKVDTMDTSKYHAVASNRTVSSSSSTVCDDSTGVLTSSIAALDLEQLQELSACISDRIAIRKRYNNTPLRRIIARQTSDQFPQAPARVEEDTLSQTDTLVSTEVGKAERSREAPEVIRRRYNDTPLRRILSRQASAGSKVDGPHRTSAPVHHVPESLEVRRKRYNNTPLRRIFFRQTPSEHPNESVVATLPLSSPLQTTASMPIPRSNTPLRRILNRQTSTPTLSQDKPSPPPSRADSVISPSSPILSRQFTSTDPSSPLSPPPFPIHLNAEPEIRAYEQLIWTKSHLTPVYALYPQLDKKKNETSVTVTEIATGGETEARMPKRFVVDGKGSPLRRILQRQSSRDWRAVARV